MSLRQLLSAARIPPGITGATLVIGEGAVLNGAGPFLARLKERFGPVAVGVVDDTPYGGEHPAVELPHAHGAGLKRLRRIRPPRMIFLGRADRRFDLASAAGECPRYWINARDREVLETGCRRVTVADHRHHRALPGTELTGDPLLGLDTLPPAPSDDSLCDRFRELRSRDAWISYFAATGEGEEAVAYGVFFELARRRQGLLVLAPFDPQRYEPVYRDALKYHLPTNRHSRLMTSYVPHSTRVYYVEEPRVLAGLYYCVDFTVAGGTLRAEARNAPDLIAPMLCDTPVVVGPARRDHPLVAAAVSAAVIASAGDSEELVNVCADLAEHPDRRRELADAARVWLAGQVGAAGRVMDLIE